MKNVTITINGKEYTAQMSDEKVAEITAEKKRTGYERVEEGASFYCNVTGDTLDQNDRRFVVSDNYYNYANYCTDRQLAEDNARADALMRRLRQWQALNDKPVDWNNTDDFVKYFIIYSFYNKKLLANYCYYRTLSVVYFSSKEKAQEAIEVFHDELIWYFTQYRSRLDEPEVRDE